MNTREDYLVKLEDKWLEKLSENYKALNKNIIFLYTLLLILLMLDFKLITKWGVVGAEIEMAKVEWLLFMPVIIMVPYFLVNNAINQISRIVKQLKLNSDELLTINGEARPFLNRDLEIYSQGIAGIQFQLASWIVKYFLKREILHISFEIPPVRNRKTITRFSIYLPYTLIRWSVRAGGAVLNIAVWIIFLVLLYVLPLICTLFILLQNKLLPDLASGHLFSLDVSYIALALLILVMLISTLVANLKLYLFYFEELSALQQEVKTESLKRIYDGIILVLRFYQPPNRG
jgi:hypothetical protein